MKLGICILLLVMFSIGQASSQKIPAELWGKWRVTRYVPTSTVSCWGEKEARAILGTTITYGAELFQWKKTTVPNPTATVRVVTAEQFHDENSGGGANDSQVDFRQLGIKAATAAQVEIQHPEANLTGVTAEIPGDAVLIKSKNTIVFSVCNVYFEARRVLLRKTH